jgi:O-antigen/teichoic acid export membrane protein
MGIIKSQSIYSTIYSYVGVVLGFVTSALLMPKIMSTEQIGFVKLIVAVTGIFASIFSFGVGQLLFRSFPIYENDLFKRRRLLFLALKIAFIGSVLALPVFYFTSVELFNYDQVTLGVDKNTQLLALIFLTIVARLFYTSLFGYIRMMNNVVIDAFIQNVYHKGGILLVLILFYVNVISFQLFIIYYLILYLLFPLIISIYYAGKRNSLKVDAFIPKSLVSKSQFSKEENKEFFNLLLFGMLTTIGGSLFLYLDTLMVNYYLGESEVGIYGTMFLFGVIVIIPARSLKSISVSVLSRAFKEKNDKTILEIYQKSSITLLIIGGYIFMGVWCNMYSVFGYLPDDFQLGYYVVLCIGVGQLFDMATGVNNELIAASPKYKLNTWFILISIIVGILVNIALIPSLGINGAGLATLLTIVFVNLLRLIAVYSIYKIQPFTFQTVKVVMLIIGVTLFVEYLPNVENFILNLVYKGGVISLIYLPLVYFMKISEDFNQLVNGLFSKFKIN